MADPRHFLDLDRLETPVLRSILTAAAGFKRANAAGERLQPLKGKMLAMIFERPSTRTRVSFEVGMRQLGGEVIVLESHDTQLGRGETIGDTARVLSRYVDAIMLRTSDHDKLTELASHATVPVINGLTSRSHPCQLMADILTYEERRGPITGKSVTWAGDVNNMTHTWIQASARFGFGLKVACPGPLAPPKPLLDWARQHGGKVEILHELDAAIRGADCVVTDTWVSMNQEHRARGHNVFQPFQVNGALMKHAKPDALFMHCLPAHRGEEVTDEVIDGAQSVVFDEAENRLHAQKSVLAWCLGAI